MLGPILQIPLKKVKARAWADTSDPFKESRGHAWAHISDPLGIGLRNARSAAYHGSLRISGSSQGRSCSIPIHQTLYHARFYFNVYCSILYDIMFYHGISCYSILYSMRLNCIIRDYLISYLCLKMKLVIVQAYVVCAAQQLHEKTQMQKLIDEIHLSCPRPICLARM